MTCRSKSEVQCSLKDLSLLWRVSTLIAYNRHRARTSKPASRRRPTIHSIPAHLTIIVCNGQQHRRKLFSNGKQKQRALSTTLHRDFCGTAFVILKPDPIEPLSLLF